MGRCQELYSTEFRTKSPPGMVEKHMVRYHTVSVHGLIQFDCYIKNAAV